MIYKANQKILHNNNCTDNDEAFLKDYWNCVASNIIEWQEVLSKTLPKKTLRENYIITFAVTITALGKLGRYFYDNPQVNMQSYLEKLQEVDWLRSNEDWLGRMIRENGKVSNSEESSTLTCSKIKQIIGIEYGRYEDIIELFPKEITDETVVLLSQRRPDAHIDIKLDLSEHDITSAETKATYQEIKDYVLDKFGLKVSSLNISQIKTKCGIIERENYNKGKEGHRVPQCPKKKEEAIMDALKNFRMI